MVWKLSGLSLSELLDRKETFAWYNMRHIDGIHSNGFKQKPSTSMLLTILINMDGIYCPKEQWNFVESFSHYVPVSELILNLDLLIWSVEEWMV